jgi:TRAP-type C4-dicarboxylate transport system substrate-binding protein
MVDTVVVSAIAAVALQWFRYVTHMSKEAPVAILAATVLRSDLYKALPPDHQKKLMETSKKAHAAMMENVQKEDLAAFKTLTGRGIKVYEAQGTPEQKKAWDALNAELIKRMTGRLWSKELLDKVLAVAKTAPK